MLRVFKKIEFISSPNHQKLMPKMMSHNLLSICPKVAQKPQCGLTDLFNINVYPMAHFLEFSIYKKLLENLNLKHKNLKILDEPIGSVSLF